MELAFTLPVQVASSLRVRIETLARRLMNRRIHVSPMSDDWLRRHEADRTKRYD